MTDDVSIKANGGITGSEMVGEYDDDDVQGHERGCIIATTTPAALPTIMMLMTGL